MSLVFLQNCSFEKSGMVLISIQCIIIFQKKLVFFYEKYKVNTRKM